MNHLDTYRAHLLDLSPSLDGDWFFGFDYEPGGGTSHPGSFRNKIKAIAAMAIAQESNKIEEVRHQVELEEKVVYRIKIKGEEGWIEIQ